MKIKDVTPASFTCMPGGCPAVFETDRQTYLIVGRKVSMPEGFLSDKIGMDELVIEVPVELLQGIPRKG